METTKLFINGEWVDGSNVEADINPSDIHDTVGEYGEGGAVHVEMAVQSAQSALPAWAQSTPQQRFNVLDFIGTEILARQEELGKLLSREEGKTLPDGIGEVNRAGNIFKFFAGEALRNAGDYQPSVRPGVIVDVVREPIGIVGLLTPWNFPIAIPAWKTAPALAFGNAVILKPAELVPGCAWALAEIISRSGLPKGIFNFVPGRGETVGQALVNHPGIAGISFTGSVEVGRKIAPQCVQRMAKIQLEMGGKNPLVVLDDADLDVAVNCAVQGAFFQTGQRCTASSRLIVTEGIHDRFVNAVVEKLKTLKIDDALMKGTDIGPVVDQEQLSKDLEYIEIGKKENAKLMFGGERLKRDKEGFYMQPALFTEARAPMRINREEAVD